jgi:antirestriction protein ArdC
MKLWQIPSPVSLNGRFYRGVNRLVLSSLFYKSRVYGTFQQLRANGGVVRKGEKATVVVFWKKDQLKDDATGETTEKFILRYYHVFNTDQADFDEIGQKKVADLNKEVEEKIATEHLPAEEIIRGYRNCPELIFSSLDDRAYYAPVADLISVPDRKYFTSPEAFYRTLFHEMGHSTGHPKRLNRFDGMSNSFGDIPYSKEELVAELCSSFLAGISGLNLELRNSAAYIAGWAKALRDNQKWVMWASARAEKAAEYILGGQKEADSEEEAQSVPVTAEVEVPF